MQVVVTITCALTSRGVSLLVNLASQRESLTGMHQLSQLRRRQQRFSVHDLFMCGCIVTELLGKMNCVNRQCSPRPAQNHEVWPPGLKQVKVDRLGYLPYQLYNSGFLFSKYPLFRSCFYLMSCIIVSSTAMALDSQAKEVEEVEMAAKLSLRGGDKATDPCLDGEWTQQGEVKSISSKGWNVHLQVWITDDSA